MSVTTITRKCVHLPSPNWVCRCRCSDHLQLIKFWRSCAPGRGLRRGDGGNLALPYFSHRGLCVYGELRRCEIFCSALLQPARIVCVSLSAFSLLLLLTALVFQYVFCTDRGDALKLTVSAGVELLLFHRATASLIEPGTGSARQDGRLGRPPAVNYDANPGDLNLSGRQCAH